MPGDLRVTLLALGRDHDPVPRPASGPTPLALLAPGDPPCHRSALRATVVAAAAAGVSAAAAWSLTVVGVPGPTRPVVGSAPSSPASATARPVLPVGAVSFASVRWTTGPSSPAPSGHGAESTP